MLREESSILRFIDVVRLILHLYSYDIINMCKAHDGGILQAFRNSVREVQLVKHSENNHAGYWQLTVIIYLKELSIVLPSLFYFLSFLLIPIFRRDDF